MYMCHEQSHSVFLTNINYFWNPILLKFTRMDFKYWPLSRRFNPALGLKFHWVFSVHMIASVTSANSSF